MYFIIAVYASFVVRPHVIHADGSLRLRYGALLDIRIPAQDIAAARVERRSARGKLAAVDANGCAELSQGGQLTQLTIKKGGVDRARGPAFCSDPVPADAA